MLVGMLIAMVRSVRYMHMRCMHIGTAHDAHVSHRLVQCSDTLMRIYAHML